MAKRQQTAADQAMSDAISRARSLAVTIDTAIGSQEGDRLRRAVADAVNAVVTGVRVTFTGSETGNGNRSGSR